MADKFWILCGKSEHWTAGVRDEIWGLIPRLQGKWKYLQQGDRLFFYANNPIKGVIGVGKVQAKFKQNQPLWPDEVSSKQVLYPYRFEFQSEYVLPETAWGTNKIRIRLPIGFYSGMNLLDDQDIIDGLVRGIEEQWGIQIEYATERASDKSKVLEAGVTAAMPDLSHDKIKDMIFQIGKIHRYISNKEYEINSDRLDVVWRRVEKSVPTYAFEVHIGACPINRQQASILLFHRHCIGAHAGTLCHQYKDLSNLS